MAAEEFIGLDDHGLVETVALYNGSPPPLIDDREPDSWTPVDLNTLPATPPVQPTLGDVGIVYPGKRHVFSGAPESAKTLAAYAILIRIVRAGQIGVLIDFEMGGWDARSRLQELGATHDEISRIRYLEPDAPATLDRIQPLIAERPQLVVIDAAAGAYSVQGLDDNKRGDVELWSRMYVHGFWRAGIATILIDHVVKNTENRGKFSIGSERKLGGADVHLGFETITPISRGTAGHYKIVTHKDRGGYLQRGKLADLELASHPETHQITWEFKPAEHAPDDAPFRPTTLMERISAWLQFQPDPVSRKVVEDAIKGKSNNAKRTAMDTLVREGFASESVGPRGAKLIQHVRVYKHDDPACNPETNGSQSVDNSLFTTSPDLAPTSPGEETLTSPTSPLPTGARRESGWLDDLDLAQAPPPDDDELDRLAEVQAENDER
jgi:hypothetical protein